MKRETKKKVMIVGCKIEPALLQAYKDSSKHDGNAQAILWLARVGYDYIKAKGGLING